MRWGKTTRHLTTTLRNWNASARTGSHVHLLHYFSSHFSARRHMKTTHGRSRTRFSAVSVMKATEAHSLSFGDLSPNDHEGASLNDQHHNRIKPTLLRGSARESYESGFSTGRSQTGTDTRFVVKASESASCHSPPGAHPDTEATRICFVVLNTKETNVASCLAARLDDVNRVFDVKASELDSLLTDALIPLRY